MFLPFFLKCCKICSDPDLLTEISRLPLFMCCTKQFADSKALFIVDRITPTGPVDNQPALYTPTMPCKLISLRKKSTVYFKRGYISGDN